MSANNERTSDLLGQALSVFKGRVEVAQKLQEIKQEVNSSCEQRVLQVQNTSIIPIEIRGKTQELVEIAKIADHRGVPFLSLLNNIMFIDGKMGWKSTYIIACINKANDRFTAPLNFKTVGIEGELSYGKKAFTYDKKGNLIEGPVVTMQIAETAGWTNKVNSSWNTLPELMLSYRAATFFGRLFAPDLLDGMHTADELIDIYSVSGTLPADAIDKEVLQILKESECNVVVDAKEEVKSSIIESKPIVETKTILEAMTEDFDNNLFLVSIPTFHNGRFYVKVEPESEFGDPSVLLRWDFKRAKNGAFIKDVTEILTKDELDEYK